MTYSTIELIYEAALATITLNRPEKRNAISFELISDLMRALDGCRAIVGTRAHCHWRGQSILLRHGFGEFKSPHWPFP